VAADSYECLQLMREAIEFHIKEVALGGELVPAPAAGSETIVPQAE
jgi:predicted RNase H-like HicB family nuclease